MSKRPLNEDEKEKLSPYIPQEDLDNAILHDGKVPWYTPDWAAGIVRGNHIYLRRYNPGTPEGFAVLGHELEHVRQYREGMTLAGYIWSCIRNGGYLKSPYEISAMDMQSRIEADLTAFA